jgi:cytochrome c peroxidase
VHATALKQAQTSRNTEDDMVPRHPKSLRRTASALLALLGIGSVYVASDARWAAAQGKPAGDKSGELHGAQAMPEQLQKLAPLLAGRTSVVVPKGVSPAAFQALVPKDNPGTEAQVALGKKLYFEPRLSADGTVACATCHDVSRGFTDRRPLSEGIDGKVGRRNAPTTLNALFFHRQFWDGRADTLEAQAKLPITNPVEMGQPSEAAALATIADDAEYQKLFVAAYGRAPSFDDLVRAIAAFERTLVFLDAPFDRFALGDANAISADARAGWALFNGKARCTACHQLSNGNPIGSDNRFHNIGVSARHQDFEKLASQALATLAKDDSKETQDRLALETDLSELGRFVVTKNRSDIGSFKTEQLRNVGISAPYMHDGSLTTLWDVMDHYNKGGEQNLYLDGGIEPLALSEPEIDQLVAFMFSLTDDRFKDQNAAELVRQRGIAKNKRPFRDNDLASRKALPFERRLQAGK